MSRFVESLKRLYKSGKVTEEKLNKILAGGKITQKEYEYIIKR